MTKERRGNYAWLLSHFKALLREYSVRYGKVHACERLLKHLEINPCKEQGVSVFPMAMPEQYRCDNVVKAYRNYYLGEKSSFAKWNYTETPDWWRIR